MKPSLSRRSFLKLSLLTLGSLAFNPFPLPQDDFDYPSGILGRVTVSNKVSVYQQPNWDSKVVGYLSAKDTLVHIYYELTPPEGPPYNPLWYRVWGGYIHSAYIQRVKFRFNKPLEAISAAGQVCEVTVPYTQVYQWRRAFFPA